MKGSNYNHITKFGNEFLENTLKQLLRESNQIVQVFFNTSKDTEYHHLLIVAEDKKALEEIKYKKWVEKAIVEYNTIVSFFYSTQVQFQLSKGNPFFEYHCRASTIIYQNTDNRKAGAHKRDWKQFNKKFKKYKDAFFHDYELLQTQVNNCQEDQSPASIILSYEKILEYELQHLETLYIGNNFNTQNLNDRIKRIIKYIPEIQSSFILQNKNQYYLIQLIDQARKASKEDELFSKKEMNQAFSIAQKTLLEVIEKRMEWFKKAIKRRILKEQQEEKPKALYPAQNPALPPISPLSTNDDILNAALTIIIKSTTPEEIYQFHKATYGDTTIYYLLIIGVNISNEKIKSVKQSLQSHIKKHNDFVLISHDRYWIQKNLHYYQEFFKDIIQDRNTVYQSHSYHPKPHWEDPHTPNHKDIEYYYEATLNSSEQIIFIAEHEKENYEGISYLFTLFFLSFCRTYLYAKLNYMPNYLTSKSLWQLCEFANPRLRKYNYLFEEFYTHIFPYLDYHMTLHHQITKLKREDVNQIINIVKKLKYELDNIIIEEIKVCTES